MTRGDIVIVDFRASDPAAGVRPALVVQNDRDNLRMANTVVVQITTNTKRSRVDTQLAIDPAHPDWIGSGLRHPSVVNCLNFFTINRKVISRTIGSLSPATMRDIDECLRRALAL